MKAELVPENGDPPIPILKDVTVIGRREFCDVMIDHASLSKRHCVVVKTDGLLVIRDLATTNGTKVKGQKIRWAALLPDDRIALGAYKMRVYLGPDDLPGPSEMVRRGIAVGARAARQPDAAPVAGFASPSPIAMPVVGSENDLEILDDLGDESGDSGWRNLINVKLDDEDENDDLIMELD